VIPVPAPRCPRRAGGLPVPPSPQRAPAPTPQVPGGVRLHHRRPRRGGGRRPGARHGQQWHQLRDPPAPQREAAPRGDGEPGGSRRGSGGGPGAGGDTAGAGLAAAGDAVLLRGGVPGDAGVPAGGAGLRPHHPRPRHPHRQEQVGDPRGTRRTLGRWWDPREVVGPSGGGGDPGKSEGPKGAGGTLGSWWDHGELVGP